MRQADSAVRTSASHPLIIATIPVGGLGGAIGVTFAPGKQQTDAMTGRWARDLDADLCAIAAWRADHLVTLLEPQELEELHIAELPAKATSYGLHWHGLPITDGRAPDERFLEPWRELGPFFREELLNGRRILVHCKGGLGRAGSVACMLLLESASATTSDDAIAVVREVRPGAVETAEQEAFLRMWSGRRN